MDKMDLEPLVELLSDASVMRHLEPPFSSEQSRTFLDEAGLTDPPLIYAVEDGSGFVGYVIYHAYDEISVEIGWVLAPLAWDQGYATELTRVLLGWAQAAGKDVVIECVPEQAAKRRIAEHFGFSLAGKHDGLIVFRRLRLVRESTLLSLLPQVRNSSTGTIYAKGGGCCVLHDRRDTTCRRCRRREIQLRS